MIYAPCHISLSGKRYEETQIHAKRTLQNNFSLLIAQSE